MNLKNFIRTIPDFPKKGIMFRDITTLLKDGKAFKYAVKELCNLSKNKKITKVAAIESRGFILGSAIANELGVGFVPIRKPGKLPSEKLIETYSLEYGTDSIEIHKDALTKDDLVLLHDDLLATGGTMEAACKLVEKLGAKVVQISFLIELSFLKGRDKLKNYEVVSLIEYDSE